jgi:hypothetical protein
MHGGKNCNQLIICAVTSVKQQRAASHCFNVLFQLKWPPRVLPLALQRFLMREEPDMAWGMMMGRVRCDSDITSA